MGGIGLYEGLAQDGSQGGSAHAIATSGRKLIRHRRELEHRRTGRDLICSTCRRPPRPKPTEADRRWWLERFTLEEIVELADAIWGPGG